MPHIKALKFFVFTLSLLFSFSILAANRNNVTCDIVKGQPLTNGYGPYDFTNLEHRSKLKIVLSAHFTTEVERLQSGKTGRLIADIDYTLRAIPNYHRALNAMARHQRNEKINFKDTDKFYSTECYFKRALYMQPKDATTHMLFAIHLQLTNQLKKAEEHYAVALQLAPDNPELNYNAGLLYVQLGDIDKAKHSANIAYKQGYPLQGLAKKIDQFTTVE